MFVLDTNVISELRKDHRANPNVIAWSAGQRSGVFFLSAISIFEVEIGYRRLMARNDFPQAAHFRDWIDNYIMRDFAGRILAVDDRVAAIAAELHVPNPKPFRDAFIAATALAHDLTVVTRNTRDFAETGVRLVNPWDGT